MSTIGLQEAAQLARVHPDTCCPYSFALRTISQPENRNVRGLHSNYSVILYVHGHSRPTRASG